MGDRFLDRARLINYCEMMGVLPRFPSGGLRCAAISSYLRRMEKKRVPAKRRVPTTRRPKASTADIVGSTSSTTAASPVPKKWAGHHRRLLELHADLTREKSTLVSDARAQETQFSMHPADAGTDSYDRDWALGMLSADQNAIYEVEEALARILDGSYGKCGLTGKPIPRERLEAIPWTRFSAAAERKFEAEGQVSRRRIGDTHSLSGDPVKPTNPSDE